MSRFPLALAIVPASLAVHLLLAACGGADTSTAQAGPGAGGSGSGGAASSTGAGAGGAGSTGSVTAGVTAGSGSGGAVPFCDCAPKPPTVHEAPCEQDGHGNLIAELSVPGATLDEMAAVVAIGAFSQVNDQLGSVVYSHQRATTLVTDGHVAVNCKFTTGMMPFTTVRFVVAAK